MRIFIVITVLVVFVFDDLLASEDWDWSYEGESAANYWLTHYEYCGGESQAPVDIPHSETVFDHSYGAIHFDGYDSNNQGSYKLRNNGHSVQMDIIDGNHLISGGKLPAQYKLAQFHFHWGSDNGRGSEHLINGHQYPLEMHLVHYDTKYDGVGDAKDHPNGIAVVGVMFQIGEKMSDGLNHVIEKIDKIKYKGQETAVEIFPLVDLLPDQPEKYFRYGGSLTTPPCSESVVWTVFKNPVTISQSQINKFREVFQGKAGESTKNLVNNFRPPQPLFGRKIYASFGMTQTSEPEEWQWGYTNKAAPSFWPTKYEDCAGQRQSPIDIPQSETVFDSSFEPIEFEGYDSNMEATFNLFNNGHSVEIEIINGSYMISGGKLPARYKLQQFHFHWGSNNNKGSEHLINGRQYPLEMHLVHYDSKYEDLSEAVQHPDGIAVVGVLFEIGTESQTAMNKIVQNLSVVKYKEIVVWTVLKDTVKISQAQLNEFRGMYVGKDNRTEHLIDNFRPTQPLFGRTIYSNFEMMINTGEEDKGMEPKAPSFWPTKYEDCAGQRQSPIDLPQSETVFDSSFEPLEFEGYDSNMEATFDLYNNGHSVEIEIINGSYMISGGKLPAQYKLQQFHFHWGSNNSKGSEHLINGRQYPLEMHLVHYDVKYKDISEAVKYPDGIAVIGVMFEVSSSCYVRETVVWTVLKDTVKISQAQLNEFRGMYVGKDSRTEHLIDNFRPTQPLFGRTIYSNFEMMINTGEEDKGMEPKERHWGYDEKKAPNYWLLQYDKCGGQKQSPIDIPLSEAVFDSSYGPIQFQGYKSDKGNNFKLHNTGHSVEVEIINGNYMISGGNLPAQYKLQQFHFHWGSNNNKGSEHLINGRQYPLEIDKFRTVYEGAAGNTTIHLVDNFREPQPLFGRAIYSSFSLKEPKAGSLSTIAHRVQSSVSFIITMVIFVHHQVATD
ncbi:hypothetical protein LSH36_376g03052 [Paralvinella palmiformis]|uniref:Carbonic anhydrase n=1 Tax=Paralvinella palmiformis TaxID=53620 RepID=A0AAD9JEW5_9ANNE|nr:hypothetical protein LSH36_376g03052 [Paralvinella palmiformis]